MVNRGPSKQTERLFGILRDEGRRRQAAVRLARCGDQGVIYCEKRRQAHASFPRRHRRAGAWRVSSRVSGRSLGRHGGRPLRTFHLVEMPSFARCVERPVSAPAGTCHRTRRAPADRHDPKFRDSLSAPAERCPRNPRPHPPGTPWLPKRPVLRRPDDVPDLQEASRQAPLRRAERSPSAATPTPRRPPTAPSPGPSERPSSPPGARDGESSGPRVGGPWACEDLTGGGRSS
jgi:hypothetical protein